MRGCASNWKHEGATNATVRKTHPVNACVGKVQASVRADHPESTMNTNDKQDMNRDPITGAPGSHPLGTGVGATGGALAGAAIGSLFGPIGTLVGGAVGAVGGGAAGHSVAERVDPTAETEYWRST